MPISNVKITQPSGVYEEEKIPMYFREVPECAANMLKLIALIENRTMAEILFTPKLEKQLAAQLDSYDPVVVRHFVAKYKNKDS